MSRCFPYLPPVRTLHGAKNGALIESIKLQNEKQVEKEKRREKKDKRKERKEERKDRKEKKKGKKDKISPNLEKSDIVKDHSGPKTCSDPKDELLFQKRRETKSEQFELSSLTEEHGHPESLPVRSPSYDSTENSIKRKRHTSPTDDSQGHGKILKRLPFERESEFHPLATGQQRCSMSRQISTQHKDEALMRDNTRICNVEVCSTSGRCVDSIAPGRTGGRRMSNAVVNPMQGVKSQYDFLLENLCPPQFDDASAYPVDSAWLFPDEDKLAGRRQRLGSDSMSCSRVSAVWARAEHLHEINAYALPYVVPY